MQNPVILMYFAVYKVLPHIMRTHVFGLNFQEKNLSFKFFNSMFYLYLDTFFLYYKGILAFICEHVMVQEILCNK